jgi:hypothetical protein
MIYRMFVDDKFLNLYKDVFVTFQSKQAYLLLITRTFVASKEDYWIRIWENAIKILKLPGWNKFKNIEEASL